MVDKATKSGMQRLWSSSTSCAGSNEPSCSGRVDVGACFESLLASTSEPVAEKAAVLLGNMCGDASLRAAIQAQDSIMLSLLLLTAHGRMIQKAGTGAGKGAAKATPIGTELRSAASTALFNAAMDAAGQQALAKHASAIGALLSVCDPSSSASTSGASVSSDALSSSSQVAEPAVPTATLRARAAGIISRIAKCPEGSNKLAELGAIPIMLAAAAAAVDIMEAHAQTASSSDAPAKPATSDASGLLDAAVRTITVLTASDNLTLAQQVVDANGLTMLLRVIRMQMPAVQMDGGQSIGWEAILGNAALCIGGVVRFKQFHAALREMDAVAALVKVAYDGKGNTASKNAAIALARMAHDTAMLERLRELHGIEIIYQYVKP